MRLLVCGGRKYADREFLYAKLDEYLAKFGSLCIISGKAPGADTLAEEWARERRTSFHGFRADWDKHGKAAGPIRNQRMIDKGDPHLVLAFPGGIGTEDMIARALTAHVPVVSAVAVTLADRKCKNCKDLLDEPNQTFCDMCREMGCGQ